MKLKLILFLALLLFSISSVYAEKCEKNFLTVQLGCNIKTNPNDHVIVVYMNGYSYTDPDNGKKKDDYLQPEYHQATVCGGSDRMTLGFAIKKDACEAKDISASGIAFYRLTKAEYEAGKNANAVEIAKKLKKNASLVVPLAYPFDAKKDAINRIDFSETGASFSPIK